LCHSYGTTKSPEGIFFNTEIPSTYKLRPFFNTVNQGATSHRKVYVLKEMAAWQNPIGLPCYYGFFVVIYWGYTGDIVVI
jgi:hypothetical protein